KSFHIFRDTEVLSNDDLDKVKGFIGKVRPLYPDIRTEITIVPESETTCKRGNRYCILFYSEKKPDYLRNIGYIGEQIDLFLPSLDIGALWFGIGKVKEKQLNGLDYVIMIAFAKMKKDSFRKDMFRSKRKELSEIWNGETLGIGEIVRFTPSACNLQPWYTENDGKELKIYRYRKAGKRGIMPVNMVLYYNQIDIGIYLFMLETCLEHEGYCYERTLCHDNADENSEKTLAAVYRYRKDEEK
ncbi:MAG: nitroreductase, partial [Erysipelotrichaceae bacterium]|nr:nitroreductase [Erysipelotrichaceae bacterium]